MYNPYLLTADSVVREAQATYDQARLRLIAAERFSHNHGYGRYSTLLCNMRTDFEKAFLKLVSELEGEL